MEQYPIILIPDEILEAIPELPPPPAPIAPIAPVRPKQPKSLPPEPQAIEDGRRIAWILAVGFLISMAIVIAITPSQPLTGLITGSLSFLIACSVAGIAAIVDYRGFGKRKQLHDLEKSRYLERVEEYKQELAFFEEKNHRYSIELELYRSEREKWDKLVSDRIKPVLDVLQNTRTYQQKKEAKRGYSEGGFERYLQRYFSDKIHTGASLRNSKYSRGYEYTADFAYIDPKSNLHIDIEIDEPYIYQTGQPIHCLGTDEDRNQFFNSRSWIVIRFSEKQVVRSPDNCCRQIAEVVARILGGDIPDRLKRINPVQPDPCWTYEEAEEMARDNYRDRYLK